MPGQKNVVVRNVAALKGTSPMLIPGDAVPSKAESDSSTALRDAEGGTFFLKKGVQVYKPSTLVETAHVSGLPTGAADSHALRQDSHDNMEEGPPCEEMYKCSHPTCGYCCYTLYDISQHVQLKHSSSQRNNSHHRDNHRSSADNSRATSAKQGKGSKAKRGRKRKAVSGDSMPSSKKSNNSIRWDSRDWAARGVEHMRSRSNGTFEPVIDPASTRDPVDDTGPLLMEEAPFRDVMLVKQDAFDSCDLLGTRLGGGDAISSRSEVSGEALNNRDGGDLPFGGSENGNTQPAPPGDGFDTDLVCGGIFSEIINSGELGSDTDYLGEFFGIP